MNSIGKLSGSRSILRLGQRPSGSLISMRTNTNLSTSSGGTFGVRGRLIGSMIGLLLSLGYAALTVWTGGAAIVGPLHRLFGLPDGGG